MISALAKYDTEAKKIAGAVVTEWIGLCNPPPQIDFQQSEVLQLLIVSAIRSGINGEGLPLCPYCFGLGKVPLETEDRALATRTATKGLV